jgi:hypothetical protein
MSATRRSVKFTAGLLLVLATLALLELGARFYAWKRPQLIPRDLKGFELSEQQREVILRVLHKDTKYLDFDPVTGWTILPNGAARGAYANEAGFRADREYSPNPPKGMIRISAYGDSFTHCDDVGNHETWQHYLEQKVNGVEALNFGVDGYGPDQALLRYRQFRTRYKSDVVLIGVLTENINRVVNVFRPFYFSETGLPLTKPRFVLTDSGMQLVENPIRTREEYRKLLESPQKFWASFAQQDFWYRHRTIRWPLGLLATMKILHKSADREREQLYKDPQAVKLLFEILRQFHAEVRAEKARPIIAIFSGRQMHYSRGGRHPHQPLLDLLDAHGLEYLDLAQAFENDWRSVAEGHRTPLHHTPRENELIAQFIIAKLSVYLERS